MGMSAGTAVVLGQFNLATKKAQQRQRVHFHMPLANIRAMQGQQMVRNGEEETINANNARNADVGVAPNHKLQ